MEVRMPCRDPSHNHQNKTVQNVTKLVNHFGIAIQLLPTNKHYYQHYN